MPRLLALSAFLFALLAVPQGARSTTVAQLEFGELVEGAERVFHGTCIDLRVEWSPDGRRLFTRATFANHEALKGEDDARAELVLPGGARDGKVLVIHGMPRFAPGDEVVLFATAAHPRSGVRVPVGLGQGVYRVYRFPDGRQLARRDTRGLQLARRGGERVAGGVDAMSLPDLTGRIRAEVARRRRGR